jgi:hypothetical protein
VIQSVAHAADWMAEPADYLTLDVHAGPGGLAPWHQAELLIAAAMDRAAPKGCVSAPPRTLHGLGNKASIHKFVFELSIQFGRRTIHRMAAARAILAPDCPRWGGHTV